MQNILRSKQIFRVGIANRCNRQYSHHASKFWEWTTQQRPHWKDNYKEAAVIFCVFGVTGTSSMVLVRPLLNKAGIKGSFAEGPWSYRILSLTLVSPIYAMILITLGTISGRHNFFASMGIKILKRFVPSAALPKIMCNPSIRKGEGSKPIK